MNVIQELHQFDDELRPVRPSARHHWDGKGWVVDTQADADLRRQQQQQLCAKVDAAADATRKLLVGDPLRAMEHALAVTDAQSFKDQGFPKQAVPVSVAAWVTKGRTAKQAAEQILVKSTRATEQLLTLRTLRLNAKAKIAAHISKGEMEQAKVVSSAAIAAIEGVSVT